MVTRIARDGSLTTVAAGAYRVAGGILGPDGNAWFSTGIGLLRVDAAGAASTVAADQVGDAIATGPDGTVWALAKDEIVRFPPSGPRPGRRSRCPAARNCSRWRSCARPTGRCGPPMPAAA